MREPDVHVGTGKKPVCVIPSTRHSEGDGVGTLGTSVGARGSGFGVRGEG